MAKKIKQKKSGMIRRQQKKRQLKKSQRRISMSSKRQKHTDSSKKIEQLLATLPTLAFEPELLDLSMDKSELKVLLEKNITEIDVFLKLITDDFLNDLDNRLTKLETLHPESSRESILAKVTRHQINNSEKIAYVTNPLLIAIFLKTKAKASGHELDINNLPSAMDEFNNRNNEFLSKLSNNLHGTEIKNISKDRDNDFKKNDSSEKILPVIEKSVFRKYIDNIPEEKKERIEEDLDVFLVDFEPPPISKWNLDLFKHFLGEWFIKNANPMEEDIESIRESLLSFLNFLYKEKLISENFLNQVSHFLNKSKD